MLFVFMLATFIGLGVIRRVSRLLHTPLMSLTNAISAIAVVGSIIVTGDEGNPVGIRLLGAMALFASMTNIVSGFLITDRMLKMFKTPRGRREALMEAHQAILPTLSRPALFIFSLHWMNDPKTARRGVFAGVGGDGAGDAWRRGFSRTASSHHWLDHSGDRRRVCALGFRCRACR